MLSSQQQLVKRGFDLLLAIILLPLLLIPGVLVFLILSFNLRQWAWFRQERIGQYGRPFLIYKFRTLKGTEHRMGFEQQSAPAFGRFVRGTHIDEWPQLINVLKGEMSFIGPRPDVHGYADKLEGEDRIILSLKPGITGPASLVFRNEDELLRSKEQPEEYYRKIIWPQKVQINKEYLRNYRFSVDLQLLLKTLFYVLK